MKRLLYFIICIGLWLFSGLTMAAGTAALIEIDGAIGPATSQHVEQALVSAKAMDAKLIILRLDTPGGLDIAMRDIIKHMLQSDIPIVVYVGPAGARAASAGTYILYASHIAAMAPATNLGAATPISIMPAGNKPPTDISPDKPAKDTSASPLNQQTLPSELAAERKAVNDATAYLRALAEKRGRNVDWAEQAVRAGASLSAEQALHMHVIELISPDIPALLHDLDGRQVTMPKGLITLHTQHLNVLILKPSWRLQLLAVLTNPSIAYVLLLIGIYGLLLEGYNPGAVLPGVLGGICLLLALYAFQILPINYAGLALIALGLSLIVIETAIQSFGILGIGGVISFVLGSIMLMDRHVPGYSISLSLIAALATAASSFLLLMLIMLVRSRKRHVVTGISALLNESAEALEDFQAEGWVYVHGESWRAQTMQPVLQGQRLRITKVNGLTLCVEAETPTLEHHHVD